MDGFTGYDILKHGEADNERLAATAREFAFGAAGIVNHPQGIDPTPYLKRENQGSHPSCTGHAITTGAECLSGLQQGSFKNVVQRSRKFAWENGQKHWLGRVDWQEGCTIAHVIEAFIQDGIPTEEAAPYDFSRTSLSFPALEAAKRFKAKSQSPMRTYEDVVSFLDRGSGFVIIGVLLSKRFMQCRGDLGLADVKEDGRGGGHAMSFVGFLPDGRLRLANSWSQWGDPRGAANVTPEAVSYWLSRPYTVMRGVSDLDDLDAVRVLKQAKGMG